MQTSPQPTEEQKRTMAGQYPGRTPAWNGPFRLTTPPPTPAANVSGLLIEYCLPYPIYLVDDEYWPSIHIVSSGVDLEIHKPVPLPVTSVTTASSALGNQSPDVYCTLVRISSSRALTASKTEADMFNAILPSLRWIRIIGRQYWFLDGSRGMGASCRGTTFYGTPKTVSQANFVSYEHAVIIRPLNRDMWGWAKHQAESGVEPPVQESLLCDALTSFGAGDTIKALIELGVAIEIELTDLMDEAVPATKNQGVIDNYEKRKLKHKDGFRWKLVDLSKECGMSDPVSYATAGGPADWADTAVRLHEFRGAAAHRGDTMLIGKYFSGPANLQSAEIQKFIFTVEMLFHWSQAQRELLNLTSFGYRRSLFANKPILSIVGDLQDASKGFFGRTNEIVGHIR